MKKVALIFTGGTISMKIDKNLDGAIPSLTPNELVSTLIGVDELPDLEIYEYSKKPSPAITPDDMVEIANIVSNFLKQDDIYGCVVVHGTDVLEETAFYLQCVVQSNKPVVLTGSMKNASELGYDGVTNLVSSIRVCASSESLDKGTLVVMNDTINSAMEVTKTHTMSLDTFKSIEFGPLGMIDHSEVIYYRDLTHQKHFSLQNKVNHTTYLIKAYAGMTGDLIDHLVSKGAKGIVIESLGRGNLPPFIIDSVQNALDQGIHVVITSRCYSGRVLDTYAYPGGGKDLVKRGCILGGNYNGQKARILLMLGIENNYKKDQLIDLFTL